MSIDSAAAVQAGQPQSADRAGQPVDLEHVAHEIVAAMTRTPVGHSSPSVYETARLVALAPWLIHHADRVAWLLDGQHADGTWGGRDAYALVPTLSATGALLTVLRGRRMAGEVDESRLTAAVRRGLDVLHDRLVALRPATLPDTPAVDLIVPALIEEINEQLRADGPAPSGPSVPAGRPPLPLPVGLSRDRLERIRDRLRSGQRVPDKVLHALEVGGRVARRAPGVVPVGPGCVGASPAATAAWLGVPGGGGQAEAALRFLVEESRRHGGPVPPAVPITVFERSWVLSALARARVRVSPPPSVLVELAGVLGPNGTATGPGLPADADTTAMTLYALGRFGQAADPSCLWPYDTGEHFCTWQGEDGASVTTNAHVLDALGLQLSKRADPDEPLAAVVRRLTDWLCGQQRPEGMWADRWHSSPYYATNCVVLALVAHGRGVPTATAVRRAARWVLSSQRADGSWGRWAGSVEETAYALQTLHAAGRFVPEAAPVRRRGHQWLSEMDGLDGAPPLWHDKDLYRPDVIVRAEVLATRRLAEPTGGATGRTLPAHGEPA